MKLIDKILQEAKGTFKFGCVMMDFDFPEMKKFHERIEKKDIYEAEKDDPRTYGLEQESHITLLYGLHKEVTINDIDDKLKNISFPEIFSLTKVSIFENEKYDVLKFDVSDKNLIVANKALCELPYTNDFPEYHAHLTIGYLVKGKGKHYVDLFKNIKYEIKPTVCRYSSNGSDKKVKVKVKNGNDETEN